MTIKLHGAMPGRPTSTKKSTKTPVIPVATNLLTQQAMIQRSTFDTLPDSGFVRESQLVSSPKRPGAAVPLPFSGPTLWRKVKLKTFPPPVKLSERVTAWRVAEVRAWLKAQVQS